MEAPTPCQLAGSLFRSKQAKPGAPLIGAVHPSLLARGPPLPVREPRSSSPCVSSTPGCSPRNSIRLAFLAVSCARLLRGCHSTVRLRAQCYTSPHHDCPFPVPCAPRAVRQWERGGLVTSGRVGQFLVPRLPRSSTSTAGGQLSNRELVSLTCANQDKIGRNPPLSCLAGHGLVTAREPGPKPQGMLQTDTGGDGVLDSRL